ncbi:MAG: ComEC/Rec2 family competence protein [Candidatus Peregrinibacteria bacterium]|nr:ComEC/Rec2 family competence protein [Candidatus Peregrinibacteria bacterium]
MVVMKFSLKVTYGVIAFLGGVLASEMIFSIVFKADVFFGKWIWLISGLFVGLSFLRGNDSRRWIIWLKFVLIFFAGVFYFNGSFLQGDDRGGVKYYVGREVDWQVRVDGEVDVRRTGQKLTAMVDGLKGYVLLNLPKYPRYEYGDVLSVFGLLEEPFETEDFSYKDYLERYEVYGVMKNPRVRKVSSGMNNPFYKYIFFVKDIVQRRINILWSEPYASFESGLLLGARKGIPDKILEAFNITGLTHIIAISGYNISLVIVLVGAAFASVARKKRVVLSVIFIVVFTVLVGMSAAVVRAAIMGSIGLFALYFGRSTRVTLTLLMSALLMNLYNPKIITYDAGFQLSFAATCGIIYVSPKIEKWFVRVPEICGIREGLQMTIAAQISTLPIILFHFGRLSLVSPLANIMVAPFIPLSMAAGAIAFLVSLISNLLSQIFIGITWIFLEIIIQITLFCAAIPFASLDISGFDIILLLGTYTFLYIWLKEN